MVIYMSDKKIDTLDDVHTFLEETVEVEFSITDKEERYQWVQQTLVRFRCLSCRKKEKGLIMRYLGQVSGYSPRQVKRLVQQYRKTGYIKREQRTASGFERFYRSEDAILLAETDKLHGTLSGTATRKICERRKPNPEGKPGFLRIDTVHQGDLDGIKGVYHINAVDEVTQFECIFSVERITERFMIPVLEMLIETFPFVILALHANNGLEYINHRVAKLLEKLHV